MEANTQQLLTIRKAMFSARNLFWSDPQWGDDSECANWSVYHKVHYSYTLCRREYLLQRRHERTAAALAAANAEIARLRAALEAIAAQWPGLACTIPEEWMSKERHYKIGFDDGRARVAVIARAALDICGEAADENG